MKQLNKEEKIQYIIEEAPIKKTIMLLVIPAILGSVIGQVNMLLDSYFLNKVTYMSTEILQVAVAIAFPMALIFLGISTVFGIGGSIYGSRVLGEGKKEKARGIFSGTVICSLVANLFVAIIAFIFLVPILNILGAHDSQTLKYAWNYVAIMILGSPTIILSFIFLMFARSEGKAGLTLLAIILQTIANIILNYVFVIVLQLNTTGASLATAISQVIQLGVVAVFLLSSKSNFQFTWKFRETFKFEDLKRVLALGFPATLGIVLLTISSIILQIQSTFFNDETLKASVGVLIKFFTIFTMLIQAAASGIQPVFSYSYGSQKKERFELASKTYLKVSTIAGIIVGTLLIIFPYTIANILGFSGNSAQYIKIGTYGFGIMLFIMPVSFLQQILFQSLNKPKYAVQIVLIRQIITFLIVTIIMGYLFKVNGVLLSQQISIVIGAFLTLIMYKKTFTKTLSNSFK